MAKLYKVEFFVESDQSKYELENIFELAIIEFAGDPPTFLYRRDISVEEQ